MQKTERKVRVFHLLKTDSEDTEEGLSAAPGVSPTDSSISSGFSSWKTRKRLGMQSLACVLS